MTKKQKAKEVVARLTQNYNDVTECFLTHESDWQLLIATILSAQCTDACVNAVTKDLFLKYKSINDFAEADLDELMEDIKACGLYRNKAKNIIGCAKKLISEFNGVVPSSIEDLTSLDGVGRKTANVVRGHIFGIPSIVVDTHVKRISNKLGLTKSSDPTVIEKDLEKILEKESFIIYNLVVINHGRKICLSRKPKCEICFLYDLCDFS